MNKYIGKILDGRYEIKELIGIGGMADVYKAYDTTEEREVAVKILKDEYLTNEDFKRRFRNESKAIAVLSHPNIVKIYDVSFGDKIQFIVMEYVNGITLKEYIDQQGVVSWKEAVHFTVQILRALQHAHDNGIVHRDVKPQNVMLLQDGTVKVMDFGIARFARDNGRTISEKAIGSVHYISPEQAKGEVTDEKTDIYSVGVMMFEMLTGKLPFDGDTPVAVAIKQMQVEAQKPRELNPDIPQGLEEIVIRAMKKDPDLRYQTAAEMLRDIDEFKRNPSVIFDYRYFPDDESTQYFDVIAEKGDEKKKDKEKKPKKKMSPVTQILMAVAGACVLVAIIALVIFFTAIRNPTPEFKMYDLVGLDYEQVINDPTYDNIQIIKEEEKLSEKYEAGKIIEQTPKAGRNVKEGQKVNVVVSSGLKVSKVPDVVGKNKDDAEKELKDAGFEVNLIKKFDDSVAEDKVISTSPGPDEEAMLGSTIKVYYSQGSATSETTVPNLMGMTEKKAVQELTQRGLRYQVTRKESTELEGIVFGQSIQSGERVDTNTLVEIYVSNGKAPTDSYTLEVSLNTKNPVNENVTFTIEVDGAQKDSVTLNPSKTSKLTWKATDSGEKRVVIKVGGQVFASFIVDYNDGTQKQSGNINYSLIQKKEESSKPQEPETEPSEGESSSENSSSGSVSQ